MTELLRRALLSDAADGRQTSVPYSLAHISLRDRLIGGAQLIAACCCLLLFIEYVSKPDFLADPTGRAAIFILLGVSALLMLAGALQSERRAKRESVLREDQKRTSLAAQSANLGLWVWDRASGTLWATPAYRTLMGLSGDVPLTMETVLSQIHTDDLAGLRTAINSATLGEKAVEYEYRFLRKDGQLRWFRMRANATLDPDGKRQLSGLLVDITEQRKIEAEVESQRRSLTHLTRVGMLGQLGSALAHELKQPLTAILSNAQALQRLLERGALDMVEVRAVIRDIIQDDSRAADVIRHLRSLLKKDEFRGEAMDLNEIVAQTLKLVRNDLIARRIAVSIRLHGASLPVLGDSVQLQQLLLNLVFNAVEAMVESNARGGTLTVTTNVADERAAHVAVSDTGPGVKDEILGKLFEPFVSTKMNGLGLGLSISRAIAASHQGKIW
ncbi:MAG TPA: ATP-binding protein, partial [Rhizomicrobium sp.]|nr:ATP-binding protein [Rhizomicrobium sp.]